MVELLFLPASIVYANELRVKRCCSQAILLSESWIVLQVGLLGTFRVLVDGARVHCELGRTGKNMASFLFAFPGKAHRRERIADLFWPELDAERSRAALNSAIWRLRKMLDREPASHGGGNVRTIGSEVVLEPGTRLEIDTQIFERKVQQTFSNAEALKDTLLRKSLQEGLGRYEGPFLEGEDADWILEERERLHSLFVRAAANLVRYYGNVAAYEDGIALARRILALDPYRESELRNLLVLLSLNDQRAEALRTYERWRASLRRELGVDPMPATIELVGQLRSSQSIADFKGIKTRLFS